MDLYLYIKEKMLCFPNSTIEDGEREITYLQILKEAERYGQTLAESKYGVLCKHSISAVKAILACLYSKKTVVMLSEKYGEKHNQNIIKKAKISYVITDERIKKVDQDYKGYKKTEDISDVAFLLSTSGTTGVPKVAMITHENIMTNLKDIESYFKITEADNILITRPIYHCAVLTGELLISLIKGINIYLFDETFNPIKIISEIKKHQITVMGGTPSLFYNLMSLSRGDLPLNKVVVSGECINKTAAEKLINTLKNTEIYHVYGLTEASPRVSCLPPREFKNKYMSVGKPLNSIEAKIQNGELLIKGKNVMKGYYEDAEQNKHKLKDGWLHTGDLAEIDSNGYIAILGRKDDLIIRAGMNIYPNEIKNILLEIDEIKDINIFSRKSDLQGEKICIQVVTDLSKTEVFRLCKMNLPEYQYPDEIEIVEMIKRNASGKVICK